MENLLFIIIAGIVVFVKIRKAMKSFADNRPGQHEDKQGQSGTFPPPLPTRRQPGPLLQRPQPPPLRPSAANRPPERSLPQLLDELLGVDTRDNTDPDELPVQPRQPAREEGESGVSLPPLVTPVSSTQLLGASLAPAFPASAKTRPGSQGASRRPLRLQIRGVADLRRSVVLSEVLGRARAFEV